MIGKLGFDRQINPALRVRLTGSMYKTDKNMSNTLYSGDRAGSRYYWVLENTTATESANYTSGAINPGFRNQITAYQLNPFVKFRGLEVFGVLEQANGKADDRSGRAHVPAARGRRGLPLLSGREAVRRRPLQQGRRRRWSGIAEKAGAKRVQLGGGWFITPALLAKAEYVNQTYYGYPVNNIRNGGKFNGMMLEGVVGF